MHAVITGSGLYTPPERIANEELVASLNAWVARDNATHAEAIARGERAPLQPSSDEFIVRASGIRARHVVERTGILDVERMRPRLRRRGNDEPSLMCEMGLAAAREALDAAGREPADVDGVIVAASNMERAYPAVAVELQHHLGARGFAYDMNVACASAAFALQAAADAVRGGSARAVLVVSPEICSGHLNFRDRDSHFIFGDACTALLVEGAGRGFEILGTRLLTQFSSHIRNNAGFLNRVEEPPREEADCLFVQEGRKVFKEVVPMVAELIQAQLDAVGLAPAQVRRFWLHQANLGMNQLIARRVLGREASAEEAPVILDEYANTSSAGSVIAFHLHQADLAAGETGVLCAFGAGYSAGSAVLRRR
ncbi:MAG TPA: beta-ketoacyl-ACP synthase III [Candidatus Binatia bacterium]|nr:beta-ketoacyl-ACP synthase III [Candidatus Binatia bacterium]